MKKILPLIIVILVIGGVILWKKNNSSQPGAKKSILDWIKGEQSVRCELDVNDSKVIVLAKGNKIKVIGQSVPVSGQTEKGNLINDGQWIYVWSEGEETGIKYPVEESESSGENTPVPSFEEMVAQWDNYQYHCQPTEINDQEFIPPAEVKFIDLQAMTEQIQNAAEKAQENAQKIEEQLKDLQEKINQGR